MHRFLTIIYGVALAFLVTACGTDSGSGDKGEMLDSEGESTAVTITRSGGTGKPSSVSLRLTDAPIDDLVRAVIEITAIEFKRQAGGWIKYTLKNPKSIDLLKLQGGNTDGLLVNVSTDADDYKEIRLYTSSDPAANFVELGGGGTQPLQIPGGSGAGLKLKQDFTITTSQPVGFIIDIDLRQSIRSPGMSGNYQLNPVMRLVTAANAGTVSGTVNMAMLTAPGCSDALAGTFNAVYFFAGHDVVPDDIDLSSPVNEDPVATAAITQDPTSGDFVYTAAFMDPGDYTVAITCNADQDDIDGDDNLPFFGMQNVTVLANNTLFL